MGQLIALCIGFFGLVAGTEGANTHSIRYITNTIPTRHHVFIVAHQDDWQLFMGDIVARQIRAGDSVSFIYLTAGDDGRESLYWQTREHAALRSTRVAIGPDASDSAAVACARSMLAHPNKNFPSGTAKTEQNSTARQGTIKPLHRYLT